MSDASSVTVTSPVDNVPAVPAVPDVPDVSGTATDATATTTRGKRAPKLLEKYPIPEGGLKEIPSDYDATKHQPLRKKDFSNLTVYHESMAQRHDALAAQHRGEVERLKAYAGNPEIEKQVKAMQKLVHTFQELAKNNAADGVDLAAIAGPQIAAIRDAAKSMGVQL